MRTFAVLERLVDRIEHAEALDPLGAKLNAALAKVIRPGVMEDVLSGTPVGHPLHPAVVGVPLGAWASVPLLDLAGERTAARRLTAIGLIAALPASASGASDWLRTSGAERRVGLVHALLNYGAVGAYALSWQQRRRDRHAAGVATSLLGMSLLSAAGWLGGHLAYAQGVGVDTTAFQKLPADWTDALGEDEVPAEGEMTHVDVAGVPVLLSRRRGAIVAMADRCTHRGAPLHEGSIVDGCVHCPWHDSVFTLDDGAVVSGPATRPQTMLDTQVLAGRVRVRRVELRALRKNVVGH